jgi:DNA invertase Pin-like site-specific DNA recombinase
MKIGYARVSTKDQNLEMQIDALTKVGCEEIFEEKISALNNQRPALNKLLEKLRKGDLVIVWKLDRLGRSLRDLLNMISSFQTEGIGFISLQDHIDTTTAQGRLIFNIFASLAEFERELIRERTKAGIEAAKLRGRIGGRRPGLSATARKKALEAKNLFLDLDPKTKLTITEICKELIISRATFYNYLDYLNVPRTRRNIHKYDKGDLEIH